MVVNMVVLVILGIYIIQMKKAGRPTNYKPNLKKKVFAMRNRGFHIQEIADKFEIPYYTVVNILHAKIIQKAVRKY